MVVIKNVYFMFTEDEGGKTAEENWDAIELVYSKASGRVTMVAASEASWENSIKCFCVGGYAGRNSSHLTRCGGSKESNMFSLGGEGDR